MQIDLFDVFCWGVDYGQLLCEEERDSEDLFDAFQGHIIDKKYCMPSSVAPRRQPMSDKWRNAKMESKKQFFELWAKVLNSNEIVFVK